MYVCNMRGRKARESRVFQTEGLCGGVWGGVGATDRRERHFGAGCGVVEVGRHGWLGAREERAAAETRSRSTGVRTHDRTRVTVGRREERCSRYSRRQRAEIFTSQSRWHRLPSSLECTTLWFGVGSRKRGTTTSAASTNRDRRDTHSALDALPRSTC